MQNHLKKYKTNQKIVLRVQIIYGMFMAPNIFIDNRFIQKNTHMQLSNNLTNNNTQTEIREAIMYKFEQIKLKLLNKAQAAQISLAASNKKIK